MNMKKWAKYVLIFVLVGLILGYVVGLFSYVAPECNPGEACMGQPNIYAWPGAIIGAIVGAVIGLIVAKVKK